MGSEQWLNGAYFLVDSLSITINRLLSRIVLWRVILADDVNLKYVPNVVIDKTLFKDNYADQIDLDYTNALISNVQFLNTKGGDSNGDGLDISGSRVIVSSTTFDGFRDKGISVGESSKIFVYDSNLSEIF